MNCTVLWRQEASPEMLANLLRANDKPGTFAAAREIERRLESNPTEEGEGREVNHQRLAFFRPFCVLYRIDEPNRTVYIERLKWVGN